MKIVLVCVLLFLVAHVTKAATRKEWKTIKSNNTQLSRKIRELEDSINKIKRTHDDFYTAANNVEKSVKVIYENQVKSMKKRFDDTKNMLIKSMPQRFEYSVGHVKNHMRNLYTELRTPMLNEFDEIKRNNSLMKKQFNADKRSLMKESHKVNKRLRSNLPELEKEIENMESAKQHDLDVIKEDLYVLSRQVQLQQFNEYEKTRSDGNSGIKQIRTYKDGSENYYSNDYNGHSICGIQNMAYSHNKLGLSEFNAVLNGIEFRSADKFYKLEQPSKSTEDFHEVEPIEFPQIPSDVSGDPIDQIREMREYFRAFYLQDSSIKPYEDFFPTYLAYLEGAWLVEDEEANLDDLDEMAYSAFSGLWNKNKDMHYSPRKIMDFDGKTPLFSRWHHRLLAHKVESHKSLPTEYLKYIHDITSEMRLQEEQEVLEQTSSARFTLEGYTAGEKYKGDRGAYYTYLDVLMEEVPGKQNYPGNMDENGFDSGMLTATGGQMNTAYYHRAYKLGSLDAMGVDTAQRSYSDRIYMATNKQAQVSGPDYEDDKTKTLISTKVSYAIPFEMIYLTPLQNWNPYSIEYKEDCSEVNGDGTETNPFDGYCDDKYYLTPNAFFTGDGEEDDCSEASGMKFVKSPLTTDPVCVRPAGVRIHLPKIKKLGIEKNIRQRYPMMPVHSEGSSVSKKLNAMEDSVNEHRNIQMAIHYYLTGESTHPHIPEHAHELVLTKAEIDQLYNGVSVTKPTEADDIHQHILTVELKEIDGEMKIVVVACNSGMADDMETACFDSHRVTMAEKND